MNQHARLVSISSPLMGLAILFVAACGKTPEPADPCAFVDGNFESPLDAATCTEDPGKCAQFLNQCLAHTDYLAGDTWWVLQVPSKVELASEVAKTKKTLRAMAGSNTITPMHGRYNTILLNKTAADAFNEVILSNPQGYVDEASLPYGSVIVKTNFTTQDEPSANIAPIEGEPWLTVMAKIEGYTTPTIGGSSIGGEWFYYLYRFGQFHEFDETNVWGKPQAFCTDCHNPVSEHDFVWNLHLYMRGRVNPFHADPEPAGWKDNDQLTPADLCAAGQLDIGPTMPPRLPADPAKAEASKLQEMFDCFSWRSFLAANWPAESDERGVPDTSKMLADTGPSRVWETYKETAEVFQPENPNWTLADQEWNDQQPLPEACQQIVEELDGAGNTKLLQMITKTRAHQILDETHQAMGNQFNVLVDQDGKLIRYEVRFNRDEFEYLKANGFADTGNYSFDGPTDGDAFFPTQADGFTGDGSIEIKASWRELCEPAPDGSCSPEEEAISAEYYHQTALVYTPPSTFSSEPSCRLTRAGLVGLHLIRKTVLAPQWVWTTFEHVGNVPPFDSEEPEQASYLLNDPSCKTPPDEYCSLMRPGVFPDKLLEELGVEPPAGTDAACCANAQLILNAHPGSTGTSQTLVPDVAGEPLLKNQITRLVDVGPKAMNQRFQSALPKPWSNYFLLNTQWPKDARATTGEHAGDMHTIPCNVRNLLWLEQGTFKSAFVEAGIPKPPCFSMEPRDSDDNPINLRNTTMETFQAAWNDTGTSKAQQVSSQSCLNCHGFSGVDGSFVFIDAEEVVVPD